MNRRSRLWLQDGSHCSIATNHGDEQWQEHKPLKSLPRDPILALSSIDKNSFNEHVEPSV